jgi:D-3-phosphoglycerate dehydrogenase
MAHYKIVAVEPFRDEYSIETAVAGQIGAEAVFIKTLDYPRIYAEIPDCDALVIQFLQIDNDLLDRIPRCKIIVRAGVGLNNIDLKACAARGVMVANVSDYMQGEVADHIMAMFLAINRKLMLLNQQVRSGAWSTKDARPMYLLKTQSMGILGCGQIGRMMGARAQAFGMKVYGHDPYLPREVFGRLGITPVDSLDEFFDTIDHLSIHMPLTGETRHIVNYERLCRLKPHSIVLNSSRGPVLCSDGLYRALKEKRICGAGLDVLEEEPPQYPIPLAEFDSVLFSPHVAYYSQEGENSIKRNSFEEIVRFFTEGRPKHWVNQQYFPAS